MSPVCWLLSSLSTPTCVTGSLRHVGLSKPCGELLVMLQPWIPQKNKQKYLEDGVVELQVLPVIHHNRPRVLLSTGRPQTSNTIDPQEWD